MCVYIMLNISYAIQQFLRQTLRKHVHNSARSLYTFSAKCELWMCKLLSKRNINITTYYKLEYYYN